MPREKPFGARMRTNNKLNPNIMPSPGIKSRLSHNGGRWELSPLTLCHILALQLNKNYKCLIIFIFIYFLPNACRVVAIKNYYPGIRIIIQLLQYQNKVILSALFLFIYQTTIRLSEWTNKLKGLVEDYAKWKIDLFLSVFKSA